MKEYKIEMLKGGKWKPASFSFGGPVGIVKDAKSASEMVDFLKSDWQWSLDHGELLESENVPSEYAVYSREVTDWVEENIV